MILLGAFVPVATPMIVVLLVAIFTVHISNGFSDAMGWRISNAVRPISHALFAGLELRFGRRSSSKLINSSAVLRTVAKALRIAYSVCRRTMPLLQPKQ
jgi:hypothetical protein